MTEDFSLYESLLRARQAELLALTAQEQDETRRPVELDQTRQGRLSRMDALQMQAMTQATDRRRREELSRIDSALKRIASGEYGICISCEDDIAPARLKADPTTLTCIDCAK